MRTLRRVPMARFKENAMFGVIASYLIDFFPAPAHRDLTKREARWLVVLFVVAFWSGIAALVR